MKNKKSLAFAIGTVLFIVLMIVLSMVTQRTVDPENYQPAVYSTIFALLPPVIAIVLALITKEVYSSLFIGIVTGAFLYANGNPVLAIETMLFKTVPILDDAGVYVGEEAFGMLPKIGSNIGIVVFLVILGIMVALMNKVGGSAAFGQWAAKHIKSRVGTQLATIGLGVLIFIDDYFNCLTVGSVMRPVTDRRKISRAKLSYLIDATAAPVCIIAPISSWAAAVSSYVPDNSGINGFAMFLNTIPYNFYAILTILTMVLLAVMKFDFGPMKLHENNAQNGDLFTTAARPYGDADDEMTSPNGKVIDLVFPVIVLIISCVIGMIYTGGFFEGVGFIDAFADADASKALVLGSIVALVISFFYYMIRGMKFKEFTECIPEGFKAMVAPILILTLAWTLSGMTSLLGANEYVQNLVANSAGALQMFLPAILFVVALFLAFSTGTSWGTFGILIPIVCGVFASPETYQMLVISISACLAGAVCGDHCSPISDTTIMASAGAHCDHVNHVSTQLPYALTAAAVSFVGYILAGVLGYTVGTGIALIATPVSIVLLIGTLLVIKKLNANK